MQDPHSSMGLHCNDIHLTDTFLVPSELAQLPEEPATTENSPSTSTSSQPLISSMVGVHFAGRELGVISLLTGIPFLLPEGQEWIQARTGQKISSEKLSPVRAPWEKDRGQHPAAHIENLQRPDFFELPDWRLMRLYFESYKNSAVMRRLFPIIDVDLFEETITTAYQQPRLMLRHGDAAKRACVIAFLAFVSRLPPVKEQVQGIPFAQFDCEAMAIKAQFLAGQVLQEPASLEGCQALSMLVSLGALFGPMYERQPRILTFLFRPSANSHREICEPQITSGQW